MLTYENECRQIKHIIYLLLILNQEVAIVLTIVLKHSSKVTGRLYEWCILTTCHPGINIDFSTVIWAVALIGYCGVYRFFLVLIFSKQLHPRSSLLLLSGNWMGTTSTWRTSEVRKLECRSPRCICIQIFVTNWCLVNSSLTDSSQF